MSDAPKPTEGDTTEMTKNLSILIPTYNNECTALVKALRAQAERLPDTECEILVADDGSTDQATVEANRCINSMAGCRYIERTQNVGRAIIRNFLAQEAKHEWLLFIDSNMEVTSPDYLSRYLDCAGCDVVYGGYRIKTGQKALRHNLRYIFETAGTQNGNTSLRQANPYGDFHTSNFLIRRSIMLAHPFDERFTSYGYEDVLFGKVLKESGIPILHIDNPLGYDNFTDNASFTDKTEEACRTLYRFRNELRGYVRLLDLAERLRSWHLHAVCRKLYSLFGASLRRRLTGGKPGILLFNTYKLLYYIHLS